MVSLLNHEISNYQLVTVFSLVCLWASIISILIVDGYALRAYLQKNHQPIMTNREYAATLGVIALLFIGYAGSTVYHDHLASKIMAQGVQTNVINATNWTTSSLNSDQKKDYPKASSRLQVMNSSFIVSKNQISTTTSTPKLSQPQISVKFPVVDTGSKKTDKQVKQIVAHSLGADNWQQVVNGAAAVKITK